MNAPEPDDDRVTVWAEYDIYLRGYVLEFGEDKPFGFSDRSGYRVPAAIARSWQSITQLSYLMQEEIMEMEEETRMSNSKLEQTAPAETADDILAPSDTP